MLTLDLLVSIPHVESPVGAGWGAARDGIRRACECWNRTDARDPCRDICRQAEARKSMCWQPVEVLQFLNLSISHNNGIHYDTPKKNSLLNNYGPAN
jgi:hypothetical protein